MPSSMDRGVFTWVLSDAPACGLPKIQNRVGELVMVENVGEDGLEFGAEALVDVDVLLDLEVDVPEGHAAKHAAPPAPPSRPRIGLRTQANTAAGFANRLTLPAVPTPLEPVTLLWRELPKLLAQVRTPFSSAKKLLRISFSECLAVAVGGVDFERQDRWQP